MPEQLEVFFQQVGAHETEIYAGQIQQRVALRIGEVPGIFEQDEARSLDEILLRARETANFGSANFIYRIEQMSDQMKAIKNQSCLSNMFLDGFRVRRPHIAADRMDGAGASGIEPAEKRIKSFFLPIFANPDQTMALQIIDQSQVTVTTLPADFVDADDVQRFPTTLLQALGDNALDDLHDGFPIELKMPGDFQPVELSGQQGDGCRQRDGDSAPRFSPGDLLHFHLLASRTRNAE